MTTRLFALIASMLLASTPAAADFLRIEPPNPDSNDAITAVMGGTWQNSCTPRDPSVDRSGDDIRITLRQPSGACLMVLTDWRVEANIGTLDPGIYQLRVFIEGPDAAAGVWNSTTFNVTDANAGFTITPAAGAIGGGGTILVEGPFAACPAGSACPAPQVFIGGVRSPNVVRVNGSWSADVPPHAAGVVDVVIRDADGSLLAMLPSAFIYFDPQLPVSEAAFTAVLLPVVYEGPGAFGSMWETSAWVFNSGTAVSDALNRDVIVPCPSGGPCPPAFMSQALTELEVGDDLGGRGVLLWLPRLQADDLHLSLHVRDTTRVAESLGTEIPVVRENEFRHGPIHLLNVPLTADYRSMLRIYDADVDGGDLVTVEVFDMTSGARIGERTFFLEPPRRCGDGACVPVEPEYTQVADLRSGFPVVGTVSRARVTITPRGGDQRMWAFVSVTNNTTHQVTTVTPE